MTSPQSLPSSAPAALDDDPENFTLPTLRIDPAASLRIAPIDVEVLDATWTIPALSAADWFRLVWSEQFEAMSVFPGLAEEKDAEDEVYDAILDGEITLDEVVRIALEIVSEASGYDYWVTLRAIAAIKEAWLQIGGALIRQGVDAEELSLGAYLTAVFSFVAENMKPQKAVQFFEELRRPPEGESNEMSEEEDSEAFLAAMRQSL